MKICPPSRFNLCACAALFTGATFCAPTIHAGQLSDEEVQALIRRVDELEQEVKALKRNREVDKEKEQEQAKQTPTVTLGLNGLNVRSGDSNFVMYAHGYAQTDGRFYFGQKTVPDTFLLRRVRPIIEGTVWKDVDYRLMLDVASGNVTGSTLNNVSILDDAYVNTHYWTNFQVQIGKYKSPVGLERLQSAADLFFVETGFATELTPNYDLGASLHNNFFAQPVGYSIGIYDGAADNASQDADVDEGKDVVGRLFFQPWVNNQDSPLQHLGAGAGGSIGTHDSGSITSYKTPGQQNFFTYTNVTPFGTQYRIDPQAYYFKGPFGIMSEYVVSSQKFARTKAGLPPTIRFNNKAWQVQASYFLTGEENSFKSTSLQHVLPRHNFGPSGTGWGAFEVVARVQQLMLDENALLKYGGRGFASPGSAQKATAWGVGMNWYLNANLKLNLNYESTTFTGYTPTPGTTPHSPEHVLLGRVQFSF